MLAFLRRAAAGALASSSVLLATHLAAAAPPTTLDPPRPPAYAPAPGYAPQGYSPYSYAYPPPYGYAYPMLEPPVAVERRSTGMMAGGIALIVAGGIGILAGTAMYTASNQRSYGDYACLAAPCDAPVSSSSSGLKAGGVASIVLGSAALAVGIPLLIYGSKMVPVGRQTSLVPAVRVGAGSGSATWVF